MKTGSIGRFFFLVPKNGQQKAPEKERVQHLENCS